MQQLESRIVSLNSLKDSGFNTLANKSELEDSKIKLKLAKQKLRNLISDSEKQSKPRAEKKQTIAELAGKCPTKAAKLKKFVNESSERQPLENLYPDLHQAIIDHVTTGAGADSRRRTEVLNSCKTLDDLHAALLKEGYIFSRQALYLRLIPRRVDSQEGKCIIIIWIR